MFFRKHFLPWAAGDCFDTEEAFRSWLQKKHRLFTNLRMIFIVIAALPLIAGYVLDLRPVMLITIAPLLIVLAAITVGGGVLGVGGMLLGVPLTAVVYRLLREDVHKFDPEPEEE